MTAITRLRTGPARRITLRDLVRRGAAVPAAIARCLKADIADIAAAGQLGPETETERGRWTGARV